VAKKEADFFPSSMKPFVVGLIGCGLWGRNILRELKFLGAHVLVVDPQSDAREIAEQNGADGVFEKTGPLPEVDGFILSTPASMHAIQIEELLHFGKPVFTEKPFVLTLEDALRLKELPNTNLFVMHVWRYHPGVQALKNIILENRIGKLEMIRTRRCNWTSPRKDVDAIWTLLPHDISIFTELTGQVPNAEFAKTEFCEGDPVGMLAVTDAGCSCIAEVSTRYPNKTREIRVHGSEGLAILKADGALVECYSGNKASETPQKTELKVSNEPALRLEIASFLEYLNGGPRPKTTLIEAIEITRCLIELRTMAGLA
jgi:predicted dehydrogenase